MLVCTCACMCVCVKEAAKRVDYTVRCAMLLPHYCCCKLSWVEFGFCICFHSGQRLLLLQCTGSTHTKRYTHTVTSAGAGNGHYICCCVFALLLCSPCTLPAKVSLSLSLLVYGRAMPEGQVRRCLRHVPNCPCRSLTFSQTFFYGCLVLFTSPLWSW